MVKINKWRFFFLRYLQGTFVFFIPALVVSLLFSSGFVYMGEDTSSFFFIVLKTQPDLILYSLGKILIVIFCICLGLQVISSAFSTKYKLLFGFVFFLALILRLATIYPGVTENWMLIQNFPTLRNIVQTLSTLPQFSRRRLFLEWLPFIVVSTVFVINFIVHMKIIISQSSIVKKARSSIMVSVLDVESRTFAIYGVSFVVFFLFGGIFIFFMNSSFRINLPKNNTDKTRPNIFIFASDSLRYDRLFDKNFADVMPFVRSELSNATLFKPMLVGVPRTFPSWVEIATGNYALKTNVRTMFPSRSSRIERKQTIFSAAKNSGYSTLFVSDFAGDIFPRYPFGATEINAPTSNLSTMVENGMIVGISVLEAALVLPYMERILPSLLESPELADPRLVAHGISESLSHVSHIKKPVFLTAFFSTAHFPYAAPGPWYAKFQNKNVLGNYMFRKVPDQNLVKNKVSANDIPKEVKEQTIALYNGGLASIDDTLKQLFEELKNKGWLENAIILIFGDHGENLYDGDLGMGHGDGVQGEYSNVTPLVMFTYGKMKNDATGKALSSSKSIVRTIDIAPTLAERIGVNLSDKSVDGQPLFDDKFKKEKASDETAYMETGIWFTAGKLTPEHQARVIYPGVTALLDIDASLNYEFYVRSAYVQAIPGVKERAWINDTYRLVARTTKSGVKTFLYFRTDKTAHHDLLADAKTSLKYKPIAMKMLQQLNNYLSQNGVEIVHNSNGTFFYAENLVQ